MVRPYPPARGGQPSAINVSLLVLTGLVLLGVMTGGGRPVLTGLVGFLRFYGGVFTLVALTLTVIAGLVATDRIVLLARHRLWVQSVHRTLGIVAVSCLALHIGTELAASRVGVVGALVPFTSAPFQVGLGSVAAYLMLTVMWSGIVRARFAQNGRPGLWRPLHAAAYLSWPVALTHGLNAGRPAAGWVTTSYLILLFLTTVALGLRLSAEYNRRRQQLAADRTTTTIAPVGRPVPVPAARRGARPGRTATRFRWDAPPAEQLWQERDLNDPQTPHRAEPATATYRGTAAPYTPTSQTGRHATADESPGLTLRDRFEARRAKVEQAEPEDRYPDDDTPTLVNLDTRRELRRQSRKPRDLDDDDDVKYWARLRGEAR